MKRHKRTQKDELGWQALHYLVDPSRMGLAVLRGSSSEEGLGQETRFPLTSAWYLPNMDLEASS